MLNIKKFELIRAPPTNPYRHLKNCLLKMYALTHYASYEAISSLTNVNLWSLTLNLLDIFSPPSVALLWPSTPPPSLLSRLCQTSLLSRGSWVWSTSTGSFSRVQLEVLPLSQMLSRGLESPLPGLLCWTPPSPEPRIFSPPFQSWSILTLMLPSLSPLMPDTHLGAILQ